MKYALLLALAFACRPVSADQIVAFGAEWCGPCKSMVPVENKLIKEGYRINRVDIDKNPQLAKAYRVTKVPTFVNVVELADGKCYETGRIVGACSEGQLRRLAVIPVVTTIGAASRNAVRALFCNPLLEW